MTPTGGYAAGSGAGIFPGASVDGVCALQTVATATREIATVRAKVAPKHAYVLRSFRVEMLDSDFEDMMLSGERHEEHCKCYAMRSEPSQ
jgi:hypothetical protein